MCFVKYAATQVLGKPVQGQYYCYLCYNRKEGCDECLKYSNKKDVYSSLHYAEWYASYYSDYFAPKFAWEIFPLMKKHPIV